MWQCWSTYSVITREFQARFWCLRGGTAFVRNIHRGIVFLRFSLADGPALRPGLPYVRCRTSQSRSCSPPPCSSLLTCRSQLRSRSCISFLLMAAPTFSPSIAPTGTLTQLDLGYTILNYTPHSTNAGSHRTC